MNCRQMAQCKINQAGEAYPICGSKIGFAC